MILLIVFGAPILSALFLLILTKLEGGENREICM
jgi:hypothetical protein